MKIPRDLKPGDRLWYSKTGYATVKNRYTAPSPYFSDPGEIVASVEGDKRGMIYRLSDGTELCGHTPPIIRIERIASAPAKVTRAKVDRDAAFLLRFVPMRVPVMTKHECRRLRAIARRLNGGKA